jgi:sialate O-acetylesterase
LALWALAERYGKKVPVSGPLYQQHRSAGNKVVVEFSHADGGLFIGGKEKLEPPKPLADGKLPNLEITADGRQWVPAQARIDGDQLEVWADGVDRPKDVRYCWKSVVDGPFLYNQAGLPAAQFNTTTAYATGNRK